MNSVKHLVFLFLIMAGINLSGTEILNTGNNPIVDSNYVNSGEDAIILFESWDVRIEDEDEIEYIVSKKIIVLNEDGQDYGFISLAESEFTEIEEIQAKITDLSGVIIEEKDSWELESNYSGFALEDDINRKFMRLKYHKFPYILEYQYEVEVSSNLFWPDWDPQYDVNVNKSVYKLSIDPGIKFKTKYIGDIPEPKRSSESGLDVYEWELNNIDAWEYEKLSPPQSNYRIGIKFQPNKFSLAGYDGSFQSWKVFAEWYRNLASERYNLSEEIKKEIRSLVAGIESDKIKIQLLYKYLQEKTRYVAIEFGIGGYQPRPATFVHDRKYGDCKDLTTYMISMLNIAGIRAYPALARTRENGRLNKEFIENGFNHVIALVPTNTDTLWLECTSSYIEFDEIPNGIEGISVLVIGDSTGYLTHTPVKKPEENYMKSYVVGTLDSKGQLEAGAEIFFGGNQKYSQRETFLLNNSNEDEEYIKNRYNLVAPSMKVKDYSTEHIKGEHGKFKLNFTGEYKKFASPRGSRLFIKPAMINTFSHNSIPDETTEERINPVYYSYAFHDIDTIKIKVPANYKLESIPQNLKLDNDFASYSAEFNYNDNNVEFYREFKLKRNEIELEKYGEYLEFMKEVIKSDKSQFVLKRK